MAYSRVRDELRCSLCLDIYSDPVSLSCGHYFCMNCIASVFDQQKEFRTYSCPECRTVFKKKPELIRSRKMCNIVELFFSDKKLGILCTYCIGFNTNAVTRCFRCEAFLCEEHLKVHSKSQEHVLAEVSSNVVLDCGRKCLTHNELVKYYCCQDEIFLCMSCYSLDKHKTHEVDTLNNLCKLKMEELQKVMDKIILIRKNIGKRIQELKEHARQEQEKANGLKVRINNLFLDIRKQVDELEDRVLGEICKQKREVLQQVSDLVQEMEKKKDELYNIILHMEELLVVRDPLNFLKECKLILFSFPDLQNSMKVEHTITETTKHKLDSVLISVKLESSLCKLVNSIPKLKAKRGFHVEADFHILMDSNTANSKVALSNDLKTVSYLKTEVKHPIMPERFTSSQVLSRTSFKSGEHYLEVQVSMSGYWVVGMAYPTLKKTGNASLIGCNDKSWGLVMLNNNLSALHNSESKPIHIDNALHLLGIYLNYEAGQLSFYQLSGPVRHLHTFSATFTESLYPAFFVCGNSWVSLKS